MHFESVALICGGGVNIYVCEVSGFCLWPLLQEEPKLSERNLLPLRGERMGSHVMSSSAEKQLLSVTRRRGRFTDRAIPSAMFHRCNSLE